MIYLGRVLFLGSLVLASLAAVNINSRNLDRLRASGERRGRHGIALPKKRLLSSVYQAQRNVEIKSFSSTALWYNSRNMTVIVL